MGYGPHGQWVMGAQVVWGMGHMGNGYRGYGHMGNGGIWHNKVQEAYGPYGQWEHMGQGYRGYGQ